jgi:hypothetical protein
LEKVSICMIQPPLEVKGAAALYVPARLTVSSSAISPSLLVMMRETNPGPGPVVTLVIVLAPNISSSLALVVALPLLASVLVPAAPT